MAYATKAYFRTFDGVTMVRQVEKFCKRTGFEMESVMERIEALVIMIIESEPLEPAVIEFCQNRCYEWFDPNLAGTVLTVVYGEKIAECVTFLSQKKQNDKS